MTQVILPITDTDNTIERMVAKSTLEQLIYIYSIPVTDIIYQERGSKSLTFQENIPGQALKLDTDDYLIVEYKRKFTDGTLDPTRHQIEFPFITKMPEINFFVSAIHAKVDLELNITLRTKSYNKIKGFLNNLHIKLLESQVGNYHDIIYSYILPESLIEYYDKVYKAQETVAPYGRTISEFMDIAIKHGGLIRTNQDFSKKDISISINNRRCAGFFESLPDDITSETEPPKHEVSFTYIIQFDEVTHLKVEYKNIIHNQRLDVSMFNPYSEKQYFNIPQTNNITLSDNLFLVTDRFYKYTDYYNIFYSNIDKWLPKPIANKTMSLLILNIQIDPLSLKSVINLNEIIDNRFPQSLIPLLIKYYQYLTVPYDFPLLIELYYDNIPSGLEIINIDQLLNITTINDLDLRKNYYLRISILTDWFMLSWDMLNLLRLNPNDLFMLLKILLPSLQMFDGVYKSNDPNIIFDALIQKAIYLSTLNGQIVTKKSLVNVINYINGTNLELPKYYNVGDSLLIARTVK